MTEIFGFSYERQIAPNIKIILLPFILLLALIFLSIALFNNGVPRITGQLSKLESTGKIETVLENKLEVLRVVKDGILDQADVSMVALPSKNPSLWMLGNLNENTRDKQILIIKKKIQKGHSKEGDEYNTGKIFISGEGELKTIVNYIVDIKNLAPVSSVGKATLSESEGLGSTLEGADIDFEIELVVYYADLPTTLPPLTQPITALTQDETALIYELSNLRRPEFVTLGPSNPDPREDPFN